MVPLIDLIWPVLLASAAVFVVNAIMGMLLPDRARMVRGREPVRAGIQESDQPEPGGTTASRLQGSAAYHIAVNIMIAYLAGLALLPDTDFNLVFRFTTSVALLGYGSASLHGWLSERRPWRIVWRPACKALIYSLVAGSVFAGLWPPT